MEREREREEEKSRSTVKYDPLHTLAMSLEEDRLGLKQKNDVVRIRAFCLLGRPRAKELVCFVYVFKNFLHRSHGCKYNKFALSILAEAVYLPFHQGSCQDGTFEPT